MIDMTHDAPTAAKPSDDNTDEIVDAIRRIMSEEQALLEDDPDAHLASQEAQARIFAALERLTGGTEQPPTVLEALILEKLTPLLREWIDSYLPPLVERLMREEIRRLVAQSEEHMETSSS